MGSFDEGKIAGALNVGYNFQPVYNVPVRTELSFTLRGNINNSKHKNYLDHYGDMLYTKQKDKARMNTLMLNGYYDIETGTPFTPFIGAGLGVAFDKLQHDYHEQYEGGYYSYISKYSKSKTKFAWNVAVGAAYKVTDNIDIDFTARYIDAGKLSTKKDNVNYFDVKSSGKLSAVDLLAGLRYNF